MARKFSDVRRGAELEFALNNYIEHIRNMETRPTKRLRGGERGARRSSVLAAVLPFGMELATGDHALVRVGTGGLAGIGQALANRLFTQGTQLASATKLEGFKPAKVSAFRGTGAAEYVQSKVTKLYYLKYAGDSYNAPFGALTATEEQAAGAAAVRTAIKSAFGVADVQRISFSPEKVPA